MLISVCYAALVHLIPEITCCCGVILQMETVPITYCRLQANSEHMNHSKLLKV